MQEQMKRWMETTKPSHFHRVLRRFIGEWKTTTSMWMDPASPPMKSEGEAKYEWAVEGEWIRWQAVGQMMGQPSTSFGFLGYDNFKRKYVGASITSDSTALLHYEGSLDRTGNELLLWGPMDEPMTGEHDKPVRYHFKFQGKDKFVVEIHDLAIGGEKTKVLEMVHERKKG